MSLSSHHCLACTSSRLRTSWIYDQGTRSWFHIAHCLSIIIVRKKRKHKQPKPANISTYSQFYLSIRLLSVSQNHLHASTLKAMCLSWSGAIWYAICHHLSQPRSEVLALTACPIYAAAHHNYMQVVNYRLLAVNLKGDAYLPVAKICSTWGDDWMAVTPMSCLQSFIRMKSWSKMPFFFNFTIWTSPHFLLLNVGAETPILMSHPLNKQSSAPKEKNRGYVIKLPKLSNV